MLIPVTRDTLLLQNEAGAALPFLGFMFLSLAPLVRVAFLRTPWWDATWVARARSVWPESVAWGVLFVAILVESFLDPVITDWLGYDLTPHVHAFEGDLVASLQSALRTGPLGTVLDVVGSAVYSYGYVVAFPLVLGIALLRCDRALARPLLLAFLNVWYVGFAAYVFLPVNEPWYGSTEVVNVLHTTIPPSRDNPFVESFINNELPSLHTALSIACLGTLVRLRRWRWAAVVAFPALTMPFFVVYLGIHWVIDVVTAIPLGLIAAWLATRPIDAPGKTEIPPPRSAADQP